MDEKQNGHPRSIVEHFAVSGAIHDVRPFGRGHINDTFLVTTESGEQHVLQKLNPLFAPSVLEDIDLLTRTMKERGFTTTELIPTKTGELGFITDSECWRMLTYIPGRTVEESITEGEARNAMKLIGRFHHTFAKHGHSFRHVREGFHDTPKIMAGLEKTISKYAGTTKNIALAEIGREVLDADNACEHAWAHLPKRIIHGDPKLNNIRFSENSSEAIALLDLDTLGRHSVVIDIADAARSWCNRADEGDAEHAEFDFAIFRAMMEGYSETAKFLTREEREAIPQAIAQIALELSARFLADAYHESYFKLDHERYPDLFTQNSAKARAQFALYRDIVRKLPDISSV